MLKWAFVALFLCSCSSTSQSRAQEIQTGAAIVVASLSPLLDAEQLAKVQDTVAKLDGTAQQTAAMIHAIAAIVAAIPPR